MTLPAVPELITRAEAAAILRVQPLAVTRMANAGTVWCTRTLGGHRRFNAGEIRGLAAARSNDNDGGTR